MKQVVVGFIAIVKSMVWTIVACTVVFFMVFGVAQCASETPHELDKRIKNEVKSQAHYVTLDDGMLCVVIIGIHDGLSCDWTNRHNGETDD